MATNQACARPAFFALLAASVAVSACVSEARVTEVPRFPLGPGGIYVSATDGATADSVRAALSDAGLSITYLPEATEFVVVPVDGKAQLGADTSSCGALRNRRWQVYAAAPETRTKQSTTFQEGLVGQSDARTFALGSKVLEISARGYDRRCPKHPENAYDNLAGELARFIPPSDLQQAERNP